MVNEDITESDPELLLRKKIIELEDKFLKMRRAAKVGLQIYQEFPWGGWYDRDAYLQILLDAGFIISPYVLEFTFGQVYERPNFDDGNVLEGEENEK